MMLVQTNKYEADPRPSERAAKPKGAPAIPTIEEDKRLTPALAVLRILKSNHGELGEELDALRIEEHFALPARGDETPAVRFSEHGGKSVRVEIRTRNSHLREKLAKHRAKTRATSVEAVASGDLPAIVTEALEIIRGTRPAPRVSRQKLIEQLEADRALIGQAILVQQATVDEIHNELSAAMAVKLKKSHQDLTVAIFRAAQLLAASVDAEAEFRRFVTEAGYTWRADLLHGPQLRAALVLGSESVWDSDISRARRYLEEHKLL